MVKTTWAQDQVERADAFTRVGRVGKFLVQDNDTESAGGIGKAPCAVGAVDTKGAICG